MENHDDPRFWVDVSPVKSPFKWGWGCAVVDEEAGGIIAYFSNEDDAMIFVKALEESGT